MPVKENAMITCHQNICPALLPLSKTDPMKTILKSFQPSLPKRDHNQSYGKLSARCSALFPAQTRYEERAWHICSPFIGHYQVMHSLYIICWWLIFSLRLSSANMLSFFPFWVRVGIFSHYHILATCHRGGEGQRMLGSNQSIYNWNFLNYRTQGQDRTVVRNKCLQGI